MHPNQRLKPHENIRHTLQIVPILLFANLVQEPQFCCVDSSSQTFFGVETVGHMAMNNEMQTKLTRSTSQSVLLLPIIQRIMQIPFTTTCLQGNVRGRTIKLAKLFAVKVLQTSLLNTTLVAFEVLPLGSYAPMPAPSPPFKTILELVLWNGLQCCRCITPDVMKMPSFNISFIFGNRKKSLGDRTGVQAG